MKEGENINRLILCDVLYLITRDHLALSDQHA